LFVDSITVRFTKHGKPLKALNLSRTSAITSLSLDIRGSIKKFFPLSEFGGRDPVVMNLSTSMIVYIE